MYLFLLIFHWYSAFQTKILTIYHNISLGLIFRFRVSNENTDMNDHEYDIIYETFTHIGEINFYGSISIGYIFSLENQCFSLNFISNRRGRRTVKVNFTRISISCSQYRTIWHTARSFRLCHTVAIGAGNGVVRFACLPQPEKVCVHLHDFWIRR